MLVHYQVPKGVLHVAGLRIYGAATGRRPADVSFDFYSKHADCLEDATYREGTLSQIFGRPFPEVAFKYREIPVLPDKTLDKIGRAIGLEYDESWGRQKRIKTIRRAIRDGSSG